MNCAWRLHLSLELAPVFGGRQNEKAPDLAGAFRQNKRERDLVERGLNLREGSNQSRANTLHDGEDGDGNARGDEAILDGGRTGLVFHKTRNQILHLLLLAIHTWLSEL